MEFQIMAEQGGCSYVFESFEEMNEWMKLLRRRTRSYIQLEFKVTIVNNFSQAR